MDPLRQGLALFGREVRLLLRESGQGTKAELWEKSDPGWAAICDQNFNARLAR
jgi:hypothetical protein